MLPRLPDPTDTVRGIVIGMWISALLWVLMALPVWLYTR